jgi:polysaccharide deacetylase family protein (PEP-CTERM system associated)
VNVTHFFTVDVEEYFQVSAFEPYVPRASWAGIASRVHVGVDRLLELLGNAGYRGTFFVLGCVAERRPEVVKRIARAGHEVASHGWGHGRVTTLTADAFRQEVRRSKVLLEDLAGAPVLGYRAPSYSIVPGREWALDILVEEGYRYDSSLFPVRRRGYGYPGAPRAPNWLQRGAGRLYEIPPATVRAVGLTLPAGGGAYFRLFPYGVVRRALRDAAAAGTPGTFYLHPWELDPDQPRLAVGRLTRIRHYGGLGGVARKLERLLREFRFTAIASDPALNAVS